MTERRYTEDEVAAIFARAAEAPPSGSSANSSTEGMTLAQLQEIGAEVGISAQAISLAATSVGQAPPVAPRTFLGMPLSAANTVQLERPLSDIEWERLVAELRETFNAPGKITSYGSLRQWTNGNLQVLVEPTATGQRIRFRTSKGDARGVMITGLGMFGASAAMLTAAAVAGAAGNPGMVVATAFLGLVGTTTFATTARRLVAWARTRQQQFDTIAARVAVTTRSLPPGSEK